MKKQFNLSKLLLWLLLIQAACHKNDPKPLTELEKLPPATMEGKYTFGCLVNGKAWIPTSTNYMVAIYQQGILTIGAGVEKNLDQSMGMVLIESGALLSTGSYNLTDKPLQTVRFSDHLKFTCRYLNENTLSGKLTITRFDKTKYIISGRFEFTTFFPGCDTIKVTDGRFDLPYIP